MTLNAGLDAARSPVETVLTDRVPAGDYGRVVGGEPRNAASDINRRWAELLNDRDFVVREGLSLATPGYVREDRRRVTAQPAVTGAQAWLDGLFELERLAGEWPRYECRKILAVRGDRLCVAHWVLGFGEFAEMEFVLVGRLDAACERPEYGCFFDPEDVDAAMAELERLHAELDAEDAQPLDQ